MYKMHENHESLTSKYTAILSWCQCQSYLQQSFNSIHYFQITLKNVCWFVLFLFFFSLCYQYIWVLLHLIFLLQVNDINYISLGRPLILIMAHKLENLASTHQRDKEKGRSHKMHPINKFPHHPLVKGIKKVNQLQHQEH